MFDLEGTLVHSIENDPEAIHEFRIKTKEKLLALGIPSSELEGVIASTLARNKAFEYVKDQFNETEVARFHLEMDGFLKKYELNWANDSRAFFDTLIVLRKLQELGYRLALVTNTSRKATDRMLSMHNIEDCFEVLITREDVQKLKPDPEGILLALQRLKEHDFFFVGDLVHDSIAAKNAEGTSITVNRDPRKPLQFSTDHEVQSLSEIPTLIHALKNHDLNS
jgi:phosphoglycolate phosphatase